MATMYSTTRPLIRLSWFWICGHTIVLNNDICSIIGNVACIFNAVCMQVDRQTAASWRMDNCVAQNGNVGSRRGFLWIICDHFVLYQHLHNPSQKCSKLQNNTFCLSPRSFAVGRDPTELRLGQRLQQELPETDFAGIAVWTFVF